MSGFYLLALIAIWLLAGWGIYRGWRRWSPVDLKRKILHIAIGVLLFAFWFGGASWEVFGKKMYWDARVRELCAQDGGIKVYETVELPSDLYKQYASRNWILPDKSQAKSSDYYMERNRLYYRNSDPTVTRTQYKIVRNRDGKVLGISIGYGRSGGDLFGPWERSYFLCPDPTKTPSLADSIFVKRGEK